MLRVENLYLSVNGRSIINDLSLHVEEAEIHGILGENGTGKTTVAYCIMGVNNYRPSKGRIIFQDEDISQLSVSERAKRGISLAWQEPARIEGLRVRDYLTLSGNHSGSQHIEDCLRMVGMEPAQYLDRDVDNTLSGGERISLPIILDGIAELNRQGSSILLITHSEPMAQMAHRVSLLCAGTILRTGEPQETCQWFKENCQSCRHINEPLEESRGL